MQCCSVGETTAAVGVHSPLMAATGVSAEGAPPGAPREVLVSLFEQDPSWHWAWGLGVEVCRVWGLHLGYHWEVDQTSAHGVGVGNGAVQVMTLRNQGVRSGGAADGGQVGAGLVEGEAAVVDHEA